MTRTSDTSQKLLITLDNITSIATFQTEILENIFCFEMPLKKYILFSSEVYDYLYIFHYIACEIKSFIEYITLYVYFISAQSMLFRS